ncbi:MAG TPA: hypothetical protein GX532_04735 [Clostridia bacterium]|jgi:hypothetical protein|nr:hypothetical protein [Clostridia bacterium]
MNFTAYVTLERLNGQCDLIILEEKGLATQELKAHSFLLSFNHEGIKKYIVQKLIIPHRKYWEKELVGHVQIDLPIALALLQDAYQQNIRFGTRSALDGEKTVSFLQHSFLNVDKGKLWRKLSLVNLTPVEFTHIYLAALKRMDNALLYDLSSAERKKRLGSRDKFLLSYGENLRAYTFLKSKILKIEQQGEKRIVTVFLILSTPEDEVMKINYRLVLLGKGGVLYLDDLQELKRSVLTEEHPENPVNYQVFCSAYNFSQAASLRKWLESSPDVFLTGEFAGGTCYKLLKPEEVSRQSFDVLSGIICEFLLTENELFIYAQKLCHLAQREYMLVQALGDKVEFKQKYYLPVRKLYRAAILGLPLEELLQERADKGDSFPIQSALLFWQGYGQACEIIKKETQYHLQLDKTVWYFFQERKKENSDKSSSFIEYYISGDWLRLNVYNGNIEEEINKLGPHIELIKECGFGDRCDIFNVPLSKEKQWKMFKMINLMGREAPFLKAMGLIPCVKGMAQRLGALVQQ